MPRKAKNSDEKINEQKKKENAYEHNSKGYQGY